MGKAFFVRALTRLENQSRKRTQVCFFPSPGKKKPKIKLSTCFTNLQDNTEYLVAVGVYRMLGEPCDGWMDAVILEFTKS
jgi:hypothetical protein